MRLISLENLADLDPYLLDALGSTTDDLVADWNRNGVDLATPSVKKSDPIDQQPPIESTTQVAGKTLAWPCS